jgi:hypothetical protein
MIAAAFGSSAIGYLFSFRCAAVLAERTNDVTTGAS